MRLRVLGTLVVPALAAVLLPGAIASAHISLEQAGTHESRYGDEEIKDAPCGRKNGQRGTHVYTYAPGEKIMVSVVEFVPHPGYFRIAFDNDGDDDFLDPRTIDPISRECMSGDTDQCGEADFYNNDTVLMDNLDPHQAGATKMYTWEVTLPNVQCTNCTLQIIQVMEDAVHGPYNPAGSGVSELFYVEDIYHTCIDLVLEGPLGAGGSGASGSGGAGMVGSAGASVMTAGAGGSTTGAAGSTGGAPGSAGSASPATGGAMPSGGTGASPTGPATGGTMASPGNTGAPATGGTPQPSSTSSDSGCSVAAPGGEGRLGLSLLLGLGTVALTLGVRRKAKASRRS